MRFVNRDDFPSIAIDLMFEDIDDVGVWFCSAGREPQSSDTNGFLCTIAILVGIEVAQPNDSFFESVVAFRGVCSDALSCEMIPQFREELQQLRTRERNVVAGRAGADQEVGDGCCQSETLILRHLVEIYERDLAHIANFDKRDHHRLFLLSSKSRRSEEHTSELQSLMRISYAGFCLKNKKKNKKRI